MSGLPSNVIRLADHRRVETIPEPAAGPVRRVRHLRLVTSADAQPVFLLETFLERARVVMAEPQPAASVVPLHADAQPA